MDITTTITVIAVTAIVAGVLRTWLHARVAMRGVAAAEELAGRPTMLDVMLAGLAAVRGELAKRRSASAAASQAAAAAAAATAAPARAAAATPATLKATVVDVVAPKDAPIPAQTEAAPATPAAPSTPATAASTAFERVPLTVGASPTPDDNSKD